jgi:hypothetical protein
VRPSLISTEFPQSLRRDWQKGLRVVGHEIALRPAGEIDGAGGARDMTLTGCNRRLLVQFRMRTAQHEKTCTMVAPPTPRSMQCLRDHTIQRLKDLDPMNWEGG